MNILITGYKGFIGRNLIETLERTNHNDTLLLFDRNNSDDELKEMCAKCNIVFHLAAIVRPKDPSDYCLNTNLTMKVLKYLVEQNNFCPIMFASSIQAILNNSYAECKRSEEKLIFDYGRFYNAKTYVFRFPNLFGKYSKPNHTSVIATFCYNTSHDLPIVVNNPSAKIKFAYINNVLDQVINIVFDSSGIKYNHIINIEQYITVTLGELVYYMGMLKNHEFPEIHRNNNFYEQLEIVYDWFANQTIN